MFLIHFRKKLGFVHVYTGDAPGVHEAPLGYAMRAIGHGLKVIVVQFFKDHAERGEVLITPKLHPHFNVVSFDSPEPFNVQKPTPSDKFIANEGLNFTRKLVHSSKKPDIIILDAINPLIFHDLLPPTEVIDLVDNAPPNLEWHLTGHPANEDIKKFAHQVIDLRPEKTLQGLEDRKGIDH